MSSEQVISRVSVERANDFDLSQGMHALSGIFWALEALVVDQALDNVADPEELRNGIANLIAAGGMLTKQITDRI